MAELKFSHESSGGWAHVVAYVVAVVAASSASVVAFSAAEYVVDADAASARLAVVVAVAASSDALVDAPGVASHAVAWEDGPPLPPRIEDRSIVWRN